ncbi:hypothetical protein ACCO45_008091 [Purpureocillium lilacinum]|uniref:Uncharacterized protein n=1 Tax=Purpureocillium lilacinum TaxID=33203 RepID=A0ACC4DND1_PURLI
MFRRYAVRISTPRWVPFLGEETYLSADRGSLKQIYKHGQFGYRQPWTVELPLRSTNLGDKLFSDSACIIPQLLGYDPRTLEARMRCGATFAVVGLAAGPVSAWLFSSNPTSKPLTVRHSYFRPSDEATGICQESSWAYGTRKRAQVSDCVALADDLTARNGTYYVGNFDTSDYHVPVASHGSCTLGFSYLEQENGTEGFWAVGDKDVAGIVKEAVQRLGRNEMIAGVGTTLCDARRQWFITLPLVAITTRPRQRTSDHMRWHHDTPLRAGVITTQRHVDHGKMTPATFDLPHGATNAGESQVPRPSRTTRMRTVRTVASLFSVLFGLAVAQETGNHPEWPRWCGKVYQPEYPSFDPGGQAVEPPKLPGGPALDIQFKPRYSIYLESDKQAEFVVNAGVSKWRGQPWPGLDAPDTAPKVVFTINLVSNNDVLVSDTLKVGSEQKVFAFNLTGLKPSFDPYQVVLFGATESGAPNVTATSEFLLLPEKTTGSVTKLDNLNGGMLFRSAATGHKFEPFLPYGFYASCDNFLCDKDNIRKIKAYHDLGLNSMVSLTTIFNSRQAYEYLDSLDLRFMYDLRGYYKNLTAVREQVAAIKDFDAIYSYWGSDEPDGHQDPFHLLPEARDTIRKLDPYHPVSVTLNCQNFYFKEYTAGADFIMEDVYPIGINSTFSKWGTPCNATYGDCGCDNCEGNVQDVGRRLDDLARYEGYHGLWPKTKAHNPQSFHGEVVNGGYEPIGDDVVISLPESLAIKAKESVVWGNGTWTLEGSEVRLKGQSAMSTNMIILRA